MGVAFSRAKVVDSLVDGKKISVIQEFVTSGLAPLTPLCGITRFTDEGKAKKVSIPFYTKTAGDVTTVEYKTVWQPLGQEGWSVKIQTTLKRDGRDEIASWLGVDAGQILLVRSNRVNNYGMESTTVPPYERLEKQSLWFVDKITITSRKGSPNIADMELTLVRCWQT